MGLYFKPHDYFFEFILLSLKPAAMKLATEARRHEG